MKRHLWKELNAMSEADLRLNVLLPLLQKTPGLEGITDVHGKNEAGLDAIFFTSDAVRKTCFGLQLKRGNIGGGAKEKGTVDEVIRQIRLAKKLRHPVATGGSKGMHRIERFVVATSGNITEGARREIADTLEDDAIDFWDGHDIMRRINTYFPELLSGVDVATIDYLKSLIDACDKLEALDQIQVINKRTLSEIFEEPTLRRKYASTVVVRSAGAAGITLSADTASSTHALAVPKLGNSTRPTHIGALYTSGKSSVLIADQNDGKTSLMRMLILRRARSILSGSRDETEQCLPMLIRAKDILGQASVKDAIAQELTRLNGKPLVANLAADVEDGRYFVFVDGFSEIPAEDDKETCAALISTFHKRYPGVNVVVAGRPADFLDPKFFLDFEHFVILAFSDDQVISLARKYAKGIGTTDDVARKMVQRVKDALQLPGSPIPAIIGVMVYEEEQRYITNTADAVDAYMTIRLGRYSREMGIKQEVEWSRKQDLLSEVAFDMVQQGIEVLPADVFVGLFDQIFARLGEVPKGEISVRELVESGVLVTFEDGLGFHRTAFRDFFAAQHIFHGKSADFDDFFERRLWDKKWGQVLVFAAGLRRHNTGLLTRLNARVSRERGKEIGGSEATYRYGAYLLGRILTNSEASDAAPRVAVIRTCLTASSLSIPEFVESITRELGNIGEISALIGVEQTFAVTVGVPWLALQFKELVLDEELPEEERYLVLSVFAGLRSANWFEVLEKTAKQFKSPRVLLVLFGLIGRLRRDRDLSPAEKASLSRMQKGVLKSLKGNAVEVRRLLEFKSKILELEIKRMKRLNG